MLNQAKGFIITRMYNIDVATRRFANITFELINGFYLILLQYFNSNSLNKMEFCFIKFEYLCLLLFPNF